MKFDDLKKGAEDALKKTVDGAKDLADKAADKTKEIAGSEVAQNIKKGTEEVFEKTVEGAKDLANKAANNKIVKDVEKKCSKKKLFGVSVLVLHFLKKILKNQKNVVK